MDTATDTNPVDPTQPTLSLREAIEVSNGKLPISALSIPAQFQIRGALNATDTIAFGIPASLDPSDGFDPAMQTWTITPDGALPPITSPVNIDGYTEANVGVPYLYPNEAQSGAAPTEIVNVPNSTQAIEGNNAQIRVIIDGSNSGGGTGFVLNTSYSTLRGLIIEDFGVGVEVPNATNVGDAIQGDFIGDYLLYPVDPNSGTPLPNPDGEELMPGGNLHQGVIIDGANTTLGGELPQDDVVIAGNRADGVLLQPGSLGSQVLGCQVGVVGPSAYGVHWVRGNGGQGVWVQSSSDLIGVVGAGNEIGDSAGNGVEIDPGVTQVQVAANYIGVAPAGGFEFGNPPPGNAGNGVFINDAANNTVGGSAAGAGNTISYNGDDGVSISGSAATGNVVSYNLMGVTADGSEIIGNGNDGVVVTSSQNQIGPGNVISANQVGVDISGATTTGITVIGNLIGTDLTGEFDHGNAYEGVLVDAASGVTIEGNAAGSQVISGNEVGIELTDSATDVLIEGTFIGTDKAGSTPIPNAHQGIWIHDGAWNNTIGGTTATSKNLISTNHWGIYIDGGPPNGPSANSILGNLIGTDITGLLPLGNEIDGITITDSSGDTIGGLASAAGNTIAFNADAGVHIVSGNADTIESNSIFSNGTLGIELDPPSNDNIPAPALTAALPDTVLASTEIDVSYTGVPNSTYLIQFFSSPPPPTNSNVIAQGETYIGETSIRTDPNGNIIGLQNGYLAVDVPVVVTAGDLVTATATYLSSLPANATLTAGDTSEFTAEPPVATNPFLVTSLADTLAIGTLREAIMYSNSHPSATASSPNDIQFQILGVGLQTIVLQQSLPLITVPVIIDGYSQSGSKTNGATETQGPVITQAETDVAIIQVQVDGSELNGTSQIGLDVRAQNCTIDGLTLTGFTGAAIFLEPSSATVSGAVGDTVWGNFIGVTQFNSQSYNPVKPSTNTNANGVGVLIDGPNNVVGGSATGDRNVIQGNRGDGVIVYGTQGTGNAIDANFILDNGGDGVLLLSASNHVGQASGAQLAGAGNLISGNQGNGVHILDPMARANTVVNNEIGTQVGLAGLQQGILGMQPRPNILSGVLIENAPANTVGGLVSDSANVLSSNLLDGVTIENYVDGNDMIPRIVSAPPANTPYTSATRNVVEGNLIGYNTRYGSIATLANQEDGINISSAGNVIGGTTSAAQNQIVSNRRNGITISGIPLDASNNPSQTGVLPFPQAVANLVEGNFIGTVGGADDYGNAFDGILVDQSGGNTLGGSVTGAGNVVSNNGAGIVITGALSSGNVISGNLVGTSADGTAALGNASDGIEVVGASGNVIGGTTSGAANVVAGNTDGVHLSGSGATGNLVEGDFIGTNSTGTAQLGNSLDGVAIDDGASSNTIGGTVSGEADVITANGGAGVHVFSGVGNSILSDSISSNDATGIVLVGSANDRQAAPAVTSATPLTTETLVSGTLASSPSTTFLIQLFSSTAADASGSFEGQTLIGSSTITTDSGGQASFGLALSSSIPIGVAITATATNLNTGDTSAFSGSALNAPLIEFSTTQYYVSQPASSATITVTRNTGVGSSTVVYSAGPGTAIAGVDFTPVTAALAFAPGQTTATFSVPIIATPGRIGQFTVDLSLSRPTGAGLGSPSAAVLTITSLPGTLQFTTTAITVAESGGNVAITVVRVAGASGSVSVNYATAAVNAVPGVDYLPVSGTLTFPSGVSQESFTLPILGNSSNPNDATIALTLSGPTGGASLGAPTTETVTIDKPLIVTGEQLVAGGGGITSVVLSFNKPLDPSQAANLANYGYFVYWANSRGVFTGGGTTTILSTAAYNPANLSVTVSPSATLPLNRLYRITVDGNTRQVLGNGLSDAFGGLLEGSSGIPGTPYVVTFGAGKRLTYVDSQGKSVTLQLRRGGIMAMFQAPSGAVQQLGLLGAVPGRSTLTTTVQRGRGSNGRTALPPISGAEGVRIVYKARPALVAQVELAAEKGKPFARRAWHR